MLDGFVHTGHSNNSRGPQVSGVRLVLLAIIAFSFTSILTMLGIINNNKLVEFVYAVQIVNYEPGLKNNGNPIEVPHSDPSLALSEPEGKGGAKFVSLGFGGSIILDLGELSPQSNFIQLEIVESSPGKKDCETNPEKAKIYFGNDLSNWEEIGIACQGEKFDVSNYEPFRYVYIQDISDPVAFPQEEDGYDLDGIILASCEFCSKPTAVPVRGLTPEKFSKYVGLNYPPLPNGLSLSFSMLIQDSDSYGLSLVSEGGDRMLWLNKLSRFDSSGIAYWKVKDVLALSNLEAGAVLIPDGCFLNGQPDNEIFVARKNGTILFAWRANTTLNVFEVIPINDIECHSDRAVSLE